MTYPRRFWLSLLLTFIAPGLIAHAQPIRIGFTNCLAVPNYSQALMTQIGQLKWYFAHASVGDNMMDGVADLHATNAGHYRLHDVADDGFPPLNTESGAIYEFMRDNPGWQVKMDDFQTYVSNGWRFPRVNLAMNKLCWIDQTANVNYYIQSMTNLEAAFPQTTFVYSTMPLDTSTADENYLRNLYNDALRDWCRTNNRVLFDIADIESHDPIGNHITYWWYRPCERLYEGYTTDGGHLDTAAARQLVARGFYAVAAALFAVDRDHDGLSDGGELIAGTCPTDNQSVFKFAPAIKANATGVILQWSSASNRFYTLQRGTNLMNPASFTTLSIDMAATPPLNLHTDAPPAGSFFLYRVSVRQ